MHSSLQLSVLRHLKLRLFIEYYNIVTLFLYTNFTKVCIILYLNTYQNFWDAGLLGLRIIMVKQGEALQQTKPVSIYTLYDSYAAMLLGYIHDVVKDQVVADEYLLKTFNTVAKKFNVINWHTTNNWAQLLRLAKIELAPFYDALKGCETPAPGSKDHSTTNKYLDKMTDEQRLVFCSVYYNKKNITQLSEELNKPGELIKTLLKEAFAIIRKSNER